MIEPQLYLHCDDGHPDRELEYYAVVEGVVMHGFLPSSPSPTQQVLVADDSSVVALPLEELQEWGERGLLRYRVRYECSECSLTATALLENFDAIIRICAANGVSRLSLSALAVILARKS